MASGPFTLTKMRTTLAATTTGRQGSTFEADSMLHMHSLDDIQWGDFGILRVKSRRSQVSSRTSDQSTASSSTVNPYTLPHPDFSEGALN